MSESFSFKLDPVLLKRLSLVSNRSDFIRRAIRKALMPVCPFCSGTGRIPKKKVTIESK